MEQRETPEHKTKSGGHKRDDHIRKLSQNEGEPLCWRYIVPRDDGRDDVGSSDGDISDELEEELLVAATHTIVDPRTVVIHFRDATIAVRAVMSIVWLVQCAFRAVPKLTVSPKFGNGWCVHFNRNVVALAVICEVWCVSPCSRVNETRRCEHGHEVCPQQQPKDDGTSAGCPQEHQRSTPMLHQHRFVTERVVIRCHRAQDDAKRDGARKV
jgi:hypothetical protein